jgi:hypothetical protein
MGVHKAKEEARKTLNNDMVSDLEELVELSKGSKVVNFSLWSATSNSRNMEKGDSRRLGDCLSMWLKSIFEKLRCWERPKGVVSEVVGVGEVQVGRRSSRYL